MSFCKKLGREVFTQDDLLDSIDASISDLAEVMDLVPPQPKISDCRLLTVASPNGAATSCQLASLLARIDLISHPHLCADDR